MATALAPALVARLRELIAADAQRGGAGARAGVWRVRATDGLFVFALDENGDVFELDLDRGVPALERVTVLGDVVATYREAVQQHPELAPLLARADRHYWFAPTGLQHEQYELVLRGDGTCEFVAVFSDPAGWAGHWNARGRWSQFQPFRVELAFDRLQGLREPPAA